MFVVEFHLSDDAIALDPERLAAPRVVGPFESQVEADLFAADHLGFYDRFEVRNVEEDLISPAAWIAEEADAKVARSIWISSPG
jgi:hypothetical protein